MSAINSRSARGGMSLEHRIPLLITALLVALLSLTLFAAYQEVRRSAIVAGREQIDRVSREFGDLVRNSVTQRLALMADVAASEAVRTALRTRGTESVAAATLQLERLQADDDAALSVQLWAADGSEPVLAIPSTVPVPSEYLDLPSSAGYGPWFLYDDRAFAVAVMPVEVGDRVIGYVVQPRPFGARGSGQNVGDLFGADALMFAVDSRGTWAAFGGGIRPAPDVRVQPGPLTYDVEGERFLAHAVAVPEAGWIVVGEMPMASILDRPTGFLRQSALLLLSMIIVGALGAWVLSRRFTRPLVALTAAARSIADGDYSERVYLDRPDELGVLADAFNTMATEVQAANAGLHHQVEQARSLARDLEVANARLQEMMLIAEHGQRSAEEASRAKSDFLATVSHELRTPINAIVGYADLLLMGIPEAASPGQVDYLERLRRNGRHLTRLIDDILDLAKIEAGQLGVHPEPASGPEVIEASLTIVEPLAVDKGIEVVRAWDPDVCYFYADPRRVEQILVNLISNAVKFTPSGGRVELGCSAGWFATEDGRNVPVVLMSVRDTGVGIPGDKLQLIFERFVQGETGFRRSREGAGLGLAISRELARLMGGDLTVESVEGRGSCFTLRLPAATRETVGSPVEREQRAADVMGTPS